MTYRLSLLLLLSMALTACSNQAAIQPKLSFAPTHTQDTRLGKGITKEAQQHNAPSGFYLLGNGLDAFVTRLLLMEAADQTLDVQYYLFHDDATAKLFTHHLLRAADRGIRVRILLDDFGHYGQEKLFAALIQHPNISIRLFNPFANRVMPYLDFLTSFSRVNRRMHNKSFIADNQAAIIGGRNIGNTYFAADQYTNFSDLDVLGVGDFAPDVSAAFDMYWNHKLSIPIQQFEPAAHPSALSAVRTQLEAASNREHSRAYLARLASLQLVEQLKQGQVELYWAQYDLIYDVPDKILNATDDDTGHMAPALNALLSDVDREALIVSPYFIPGNSGVASFANWIDSGAKVTTLTNSLAANDVPVVHAGYARYRQPLINAGVELWELQPSAKAAKKRKRDKDLPGSSKASLHAKTMIFDRDTMFVGSMNLDPRSINLNTEIGVLIYSEELAEFASQALLAELPNHAWRLDTAEKDGFWGSTKQLVWLDESTQPASIISHGSEPEADRWSRFQAWIFGFLPLESML
ncbi:phospholipase D family protein [Oceanisphaera pacifica]|uniref:Phospholipase D family protein n=1 Tax=Oceanisphaera pacifica TaxID=2818389 RepID=A0ABS3NGQ1_9GAMM|nr:phospholipase D family protein [Oceanisphaera pacifica]MBO1519573.1 phospholipase D family protein [Oceanisphaera pacifica]